MICVCIRKKKGLLFCFYYFYVRFKGVFSFTISSGFSPLNLFFYLRIRVCLVLFMVRGNKNVLDSMDFKRRLDDCYSDVLYLLEKYTEREISWEQFGDLLVPIFFHGWALDPGSHDQLEDKNSLLFYFEKFDSFESYVQALILHVELALGVVTWRDYFPGREYPPGSLSDGFRSSKGELYLLHDVDNN